QYIPQERNTHTQTQCSQRENTCKEGNKSTCLRLGQQRAQPRHFRLARVSMQEERAYTHAYLEHGVLVVAVVIQAVTIFCSHQTHTQTQPQTATCRNNDYEPWYAWSISAIFS